MEVPSKLSFPSPTSSMDGKTFPTPGADPGVLPASIDFRPYLVIPDVILPCQEASIHPADSQQGPEDACCQVFVPGPESSQPEQRSQEEAQENSAQNIGLDVPFSWRGCFPGHFRDLGPFGFEIPHIDAPVPICGPYGVQVDIPPSVLSRSFPLSVHHRTRIWDTNIYHPWLSLLPTSFWG